MTKKKENETRLQQLKNIVASLPEKPGSYQYYDAEGTIIYVGKAKNLKRRVSSYFNKEQQSAKTTMLVSKIHNIKYIVVNTEEDALLLENNLIKQYKPKYNVLLKDDKTYPSICITKEDYPRIYKTRQINLKILNTAERHSSDGRSTGMRTTRRKVTRTRSSSRKTKPGRS